MINEELRQEGVTDKDLRQRMHRKLNKYSYQNTLKGLIENSDELKFEKLEEKHIDPFVCLNGLNGKKGFIYKNYRDTARFRIMNNIKTYIKKTFDSCLRAEL